MRVWLFLLGLFLFASFHGCFGKSVTWIPTGSRQCDPSQVPLLRKTKLWNDTFGQGKWIGCLRVSWKGKQAGAVTQPVRISAQGLVTGYDPDAPTQPKDIVLSIPPSARKVARTFSVFAFGRMLISVNKAISFCQKEMAAFDYVCERKKRGRCWFSWEFQPISSDSSLLTSSFPANQTCFLSLPSSSPERKEEVEPTEEGNPEKPDASFREPQKEVPANEKRQQERNISEETSIPEQEPVLETTPDNKLPEHPNRQCTAPASALLLGGGKADIGTSVAVDTTGNVYLTGSFQEKALFGTKRLQTATGPNVFVSKFTSSKKILWTKQLSGTWSSSTKLILDDKGNVVVIGRFQGTARMGSFSLKSKGLSDFFVLKLDAQGNVLWALSGGGAGQEEVADVTLGANGVLYVTGSFSGKISIAGTTISTLKTSVFLASISAQGKFLVASKIFSLPQGVAETFGKAVLFDKKRNNLYVAGLFRDKIQDLINLTVVTKTSKGGNDLFLVKVNLSDFSPLWLRAFGGTNNDSFGGVGLNSSGHIVFSGVLDDNLTLQGSVFSQPNGEALYLLSFTEAGRVGPVATRSVRKASLFINNMIIDQKDNLYLTGRFSNTVQFLVGSFTSKGKSDLFVAKTRRGKILWFSPLGNADTNIGFGLFLGQTGRIYVAGRSFGELKVDGKTISAFGDADILLYSLCVP